MANPRFCRRRRLRLDERIFWLRVTGNAEREVELHQRVVDHFAFVHVIGEEFDRFAVMPTKQRMRREGPDERGKHSAAVDRLDRLRKRIGFLVVLRATARLAQLSICASFERAESANTSRHQG